MKTGVNPNRSGAYTVLRLHSLRGGSTGASAVVPYCEGFYFNSVDMVVWHAPSD